MRGGFQEVGGVALLLGVNTALHMLLTYNSVSLIVAPLVSATVLTWSVAQPFRYLLAIAIVSELFATLPLGIMTLIIFLPLVLYRWRGRIERDISFHFLFIVALTALCQVVLLISASQVIAWHDLSTLPLLLSHVPWQISGAVWLCGTVIVFAESLVLGFFLPQSLRQGMVR